MTELVPPDLIPKWIPGRLTADSSHLRWPGVTLKGYVYDEQEVSIPKMRDYMIVVYQGERAVMRRHTGGRWRSDYVEPGVITLLTRAENSVWHWDRPIDVKHIYLQHDCIAATASEVFEKEVEKVEIPDRIRSEDSIIQNYCKILEEELSGLGVGGRLYLDALRTQLAIHLLRNYAEMRFRQEQNGTLGSHLRQRVVDYIEENISSNLSLREIAAIAGQSPYHFSRKFKADFGMPPHAYVIVRRIERAKYLLRRGDMPLKLISAECGFSDQSHMTRVFQKKLGITPGKMRRDR